MTSNVELDDAMRGVRGYMGCVPVDGLPKRLKQHACCIINLQTGDEDGSHWVCCACVGGHRVYFDPFGAPPDDRVVRWLEPTAVNTGRYQHLDSEQCGEFCVYLLHHLMRHGDIYQALYEDIVPGADNEASVKDFYRTLQKGGGAMAKGKAEQQDGYCLKCKAKKTMKDAHTSTLKNGRSAMKGVCSTCGTKMSRIMKGSGLYLPGR
jgi:hypothetical protein